MVREEIVWLRRSLNTKKYEFHWMSINMFAFIRMRLFSKTSWFKHDVPAEFLEINFNCDALTFIKFKECNWFVRS
jgi:hypothetical protein